MSLYINFKLLLSVVLFCQYVYSVDDKRKDDFRQTGTDGQGQGQSLYWFGPRLGKRSVDERRETLLKLFEAADALKYYYDQLPNYEAQSDDGDTKGFKVYFTPKLGRSLNSMYQDDKSFENVEFTPRLGRRLPEDYGVTQPDQDVYKSDPDQKDRRTKFFSPRLGRSVNFSPRLGRSVNFSPRLGKSIPYDMYPEHIRVERSLNETKST